MLRDNQILEKIFQERLAATGPRFQAKVLYATEIIVFGSMAAGCDRPDSDLDVLCITGTEYCKFKNGYLDLIVVPSGVVWNRQWLHGELATHVAAYGSWIKGAPTWTAGPWINQKEIDNKRRRISAYMRCLRSSWTKLETCFRLKYTTKLRRETQRMILLERNIPVPPTAVLDRSWISSGEDVCAVFERLRQFPSLYSSFFVDHLLASANFQISHDHPSQTRDNDLKKLEHVDRLRRTKRLLIRNSRSKSEVVEQNIPAYQRPLDLAAQADESEGIRQGLEDIKFGRTRPAREVLEAFRRSRGIPR